PRIAGISSFGAGGSNAHVVVEEYVAEEPRRVAKARANGPALIVLSARNEERLKDRAQQLREFVERDGLGDEDLLNVAYTLQIGREAMEYRLAFTANT